MIKKPAAGCMRAMALAWAAIVLFFPSGPAARASSRPRPKATVTISGAWALYPLAVKWREEFVRVHPDVQIDVQAGGAGKGITDVVAGAADIGMVSREIKTAELEKGIAAVAVARDAVVAVFSEKNPLAGKILRCGMTRESFAAIWLDGTVKNWGQAINKQATGGSGKTSLHVYTRADACGAAETWAAYLGGHQEDLIGIGVYGDPGLLEAVRRDALAAGYSNLNFAYDPETGRPVAGLLACPIDLNANGRLDREENFYACRDDLTGAIGRGAYPSPPARDLYFVVKGWPGSGGPALFLEWALTDGQRFVAEMGYIALAAEKIAAGLKIIKEISKEGG